jgi:NAD(P)-dependent dehydrogenase (short-subunit alcohol dehydrogenase family)
MSKCIKDKIALITGGTSGIGAATAILFGREGATVVVSGRREKEGSTVVDKIIQEGGKAKFIQCDVSKEDEVKNLIQETVTLFGRIDIAFNNAGVEQAPLVPLTETTTEEYNKLFSINVFGVWICMKYEIQAMLQSAKTSGCSIINTSSVAGHIGMPGASTYIATKHAVEGLTKSVALEVADKGIRINAVAPAAIETDMVDRFAGGMNSEMAQYLRSLHPVGRMGTSEEIAQAVLYLVSPGASFTTGISLPVDGGWLAK